MMVRVSSRIRVSRMLPMFGSRSVRRKMPMPPMPSSGLTMMSPCSAKKARTSAARVETRVGAVNREKFKMASFSLKSRMACPLLNTFAPCCSARVSSWVLYKYCISNGGSVRIITASNSVRAACTLSCGLNHSWSWSSFAPINWKGAAWATTLPFCTESSPARVWCNLCPRLEASRIMA